MAKMDLNLEAISVGGSFSVLPTGVYRVAVSSTEIKKTAKGGHMLVIGMTVKDGVSEGKTVVNRFNIVNDNPDTVRYALRDIKTILTVGGFANPNLLPDSDDMLGLEFMVSLEERESTQKKDDGTFFMENKWMGYFKATKQEALPENVPTNAPTTAPTPANAEAKAKLPWD